MWKERGQKVTKVRATAYWHTQTGDVCIARHAAQLENVQKQIRTWLPPTRTHKVDGRPFLQPLARGARAVGALAARQVDQVDKGNLVSRRARRATNLRISESVRAAA